jgi:hypothetical protein
MTAARAQSSIHWRNISNSVLALLQQPDQSGIPLQRCGRTLTAKIRVRLRVHPHCGAPVLEVLSPNRRGGLALNWRDLKRATMPKADWKAFRRAFEPRMYAVHVSCPAIKKQAGWYVPASSKASAWRKGVREFCDRFPCVLTDGLAIGGNAELLR